MFDRKSRRLNTINQLEKLTPEYTIWDWWLRCYWQRWDWHKTLSLCERWSGLLIKIVKWKVVILCLWTRYQTSRPVYGLMISGFLWKWFNSCTKSLIWLSNCCHGWNIWRIDLNLVDIEYEHKKKMHPLCYNKLLNHDVLHF